jgi:hypothetical protein
VGQRRALGKIEADAPRGALRPGPHRAAAPRAVGGARERRLSWSQP